MGPKASLHIGVVYTLFQATVNNLCKVLVKGGIFGFSINFSIMCGRISSWKVGVPFPFISREHWELYMLMVNFGLFPALPVASLFMALIMISGVFPDKSVTFSHVNTTENFSLIFGSLVISASSDFNSS